MRQSLRPAASPALPAPTAATDTLVACCQLELVVGELEANRARAQRAVRAAAGRGARVIVLPELTASGYVFEDAAEAAALAEPADGPTIAGWAALAAELDVVVVGGFCERATGGALHSAAALVDPSGVRAIYRKAHLWDREQLVFTPGDAPPPVIDTVHGRLGVVVCYDLELPEWVRIVALAGAELLCAPVNWPLLPRPPLERPMEIVRVQAQAAMNRVFVAACDRAGEERGVDWVGGSVIVDPDGWPFAGPLAGGETETIIAACDLPRARDKSLNARNDVHGDRRLDLYAAASRPRSDDCRDESRG